VFVVAGALEFALAQLQGRATPLSVEFLNWAANETCDDSADGAFFSDLWKGFTAHGVCREEEMPYRPGHDPASRPPPGAVADARTRLGLGLRLNWIKPWDVTTGLTDEHMASIRRTLADGWPVCAGFRWPKNPRWEQGVLQMCGPDAVFDGHSVLLVGYRADAAQPGGGVFTFRNSGGEGRDGYLPYAYAQAYMNDAAWVDAAPVNGRSRRAQR
jgi:hypothetical protein